jgi:hypothetical protein
MGKTYLSNALSLNMLDTSSALNIYIEPVSPAEVSTSNFISVIGHPDTANVIASLLDCEVPFNRCSLSLTAEDTLFVAQYKGPRLPEGATKLPEGATIEFLKVTLR